MVDVPQDEEKPKYSVARRWLLSFFNELNQTSLDFWDRQASKSGTFSLTVAICPLVIAARGRHASFSDMSDAVTVSLVVSIFCLATALVACFLTEPPQSWNRNSISKATKCHKLFAIGLLLSLASIYTNKWLSWSPKIIRYFDLDACYDEVCFAEIVWAFAAPGALVALFGVLILSSRHSTFRHTVLQGSIVARLKLFASAFTFAAAVLFLTILVFFGAPGPSMAGFNTLLESVKTFRASNF